jgi:FkbM family methyltransferase
MSEISPPGLQNFQPFNTSDLVITASNYGPMLTHRADLIIGESLRAHGHFQEEKISAVSDFLSTSHNFKHETFVDVGANIGTHLIFALLSGGFAKGVGVEPDRQNFRLLSCNLLLNGLENRTSLHHVELSDSSGWASLELSTDNFGDHRIRCETTSPHSFNEHQRESYAVPKVHAGEWLLQSGLDPESTLFWLDTQGHEGHIFRSMPLAGAICSPKFVVTEFWPYGLERAGGKPYYFDYLKQCVAIYDINKPNWQHDGRVTPDMLGTLYDTMLAETSITHYPHTDLLCVRV